jgi:hypothetical protein
MRFLVPAVMLLASLEALGQSKPSLVLDSGSGTGSLAVFRPGSTDNEGWVVVESGSAPAADAGIVSVMFGTQRKRPTAGCLESKSASAKDLRIDDFFPVSRYGFVVMIHYPGLKPHTRYVWRYEIGLQCAFR